MGRSDTDIPNLTVRLHLLELVGEVVDPCLFCNQPVGNEERYAITLTDMTALERLRVELSGSAEEQVARLSKDASPKARLGAHAGT